MKIKIIERPPCELQKLFMNNRPKAPLASPEAMKMLEARMLIVAHRERIASHESAADALREWGQIKSSVRMRLAASRSRRRVVELTKFLSENSEDHLP